jgi:hypothetical protein
VVCSKLAVLAYDDVLAPMPAMATGSAAGYSASVAAMGFSLMVNLCIWGDAALDFSWLKLMYVCVL